MPYRLTLTEADESTIAFVGNRYAWSSALLRYSAGTNSLSESEAWSIANAIDDDDALLPMLDPRSDLASELLRLLESIV